MHVMSKTGDLRVKISHALAELGPDISDEYRDKVITLLEKLAQNQDESAETLASLQGDVKSIAKSIREYDAILAIYNHRLEESEKRLQERSREDVGRCEGKAGANTGPGVEGLAAEDRGKDSSGV